MILNIERDHSRFRQIVRGRIRKDLKKYMSSNDMIGRKGKDIVSIPIPQIEIPRLKFDDRKRDGVGQGEGGPGDSAGQQEGQAGDAPGRHILEVEVTLEELAQIMGEELELPRIEPKDKNAVDTHFDRYSGLRQTGPRALLNLRRSFRESLKRQMASGLYDPKRPVLIPVKDDLRFRSWKETTKPRSDAVIIYMMDVSGSMGDEQKEIVRLEAFWIDTWLASQYRGIETRYIIHDAAAAEVDADTFYRTKESGGTKISSAYEVALELIENRFPPSEYNLYLFHFSDGDNWSGGDTEICLQLLAEKLLPQVNLFGYGQVASPYGSGQFIKDLQQGFPEAENLILSEIPNHDSIMDSIREFLGKGK